VEEIDPLRMFDTGEESQHVDMAWRWRVLEGRKRSWHGYSGGLVCASEGYFTHVDLQVDHCTFAAFISPLTYSCACSRT
jgi:hypothetical protein